jgi:hypothetical protein
MLPIADRLMKAAQAAGWAREEAGKRGRSSSSCSPPRKGPDSSGMRPWGGMDSREGLPRGPLPYSGDMGVWRGPVHPGWVPPFMAHGQPYVTYMASKGYEAGRKTSCPPVKKGRKSTDEEDIGKVRGKDCTPRYHLVKTLRFHPPSHRGLGHTQSKAW